MVWNMKSKFTKIKIQAECGGEQYRCSSGECVPGHLVCSGSPECEDGSDEADCAANLVPAPACLDSEFHCGVGGACVPLERVCDQRNDCGDWQDEQGCACREENGGCQQVWNYFCVNCIA